MICTQKHKDTA